MSCRQPFTNTPPHFRVQMWSTQRPWWKNAESPYKEERDAMLFYSRISATPPGLEGIYARVIPTDEKGVEHELVSSKRTTRDQLRVQDLYKRASRIRENQTFDLLAQRMENAAKAFASGRITAENLGRIVDEVNDKVRKIDTYARTL